MTYMDKVREKIQNSNERVVERIALWEIVSKANEQGGVEEVKSKLSLEIQGLGKTFTETIEKLQNLLQ